MQLDGCDNFQHCYLDSYVWSDAILQWIQEKNDIKFCSDLGNSGTETLAMIKQAFGEESMTQQA
jgi:hypothetical protein